MKRVIGRWGSTMMTMPFSLQGPSKTMIFSLHKIAGMPVPQHQPPPRTCTTESVQVGFTTSVWQDCAQISKVLCLDKACINHCVM